MHGANQCIRLGREERIVRLALNLAPDTRKREHWPRRNRKPVRVLLARHRIGLCAPFLKLGRWHKAAMVGRFEHIAPERTFEVADIRHQLASIGNAPRHQARNALPVPFDDNRAIQAGCDIWLCHIGLPVIGSAEQADNFGPGSFEVVEVAHAGNVIVLARAVNPPSPMPIGRDASASAAGQFQAEAYSNSSRVTRAPASSQFVSAACDFPNLSKWAFAQRLNHEPPDVGRIILSDKLRMVGT